MPTIHSAPRWTADRESRAPARALGSAVPGCHGQLRRCGILLLQEALQIAQVAIAAARLGDGAAHGRAVLDGDVSEQGSTNCSQSEDVANRSSRTWWLGARRHRGWATWMWPVEVGAARAGAGRRSRSGRRWRPGRCSRPAVDRGRAIAIRPATTSARCWTTTRATGSLFETLALFRGDPPPLSRKPMAGSPKRAVATQPDLWSAQRELGLNLMRLGDLAEVRAPHLSPAYRRRRVQHHHREHAAAARQPGDQFEIIEAHEPRAEACMLNRRGVGAAAPLCGISCRTSASIGHVLRGAMAIRRGSRWAIEIYPNHDDFAVRIAGLPGIGLLGVTFGRPGGDGQSLGATRAATSTGAARCGTRWRMCSRCRSRSTACRAG